MDISAVRLDTGPSEVTLWSFPLDVTPALREQLSGLLNQEEQARAAKFVFERDAHRFACARATLRILLAERIGLTPVGVAFDLEPGTTKPRLTESSTTRRVAFNLSHSADRALLAIADAEAIPALGVDLEFIELKTDVDGVAERFFSTRERAELTAIKDRAQRVDAFYACWTRKEALLKGVGIGLQAALEDFDVDLTATVPFGAVGRKEAGDLVAGWTLHPLATDPGWAAALAIRDRFARPTASGLR